MGFWPNKLFAAFGSGLLGVALPRGSWNTDFVFSWPRDIHSEFKKAKKDCRFISEGKDQYVLTECNRSSESIFSTSVLTYEMDRNKVYFVPSRVVYPDETISAKVLIAKSRLINYEVIEASKEISSATKTEYLEQVENIGD